MVPRAVLTSIIQDGVYNPYLGTLATAVSAALWFLFVEVVGVEWAVIALLPSFMQQPLNKERKRCFALVSRYSQTKSEFPRMISAAYPPGDMMGSPATSSSASASSSLSKLPSPAPQTGLSSEVSSPTSPGPLVPPSQQDETVFLLSPSAVAFANTVEAAEAEAARRMLGQLKARCAGMINAVFSVVLALTAALDPTLRYNPLFGVSSTYFVCASFICGYFVWDFYTILRRWGADGDGWQWLLHCIISGGALISPFFAKAAPLSYYGALMICLEASTPFMSFRWMSIKAKTLLGPTDEGEATLAEWWIRATSLMFAITFFGIRIVWAPVVMFVPLLRHLLLGELVLVMSPVRRWIYVILIVSFYSLNVFWMLGIIRAALRQGAKKRRIRNEGRFSKTC